MATLYAINPLSGVMRGRTGRRVHQPPGGGNVAVAMGNTFSPVAAAGMWSGFCKVPAGAVINGGTIAGLGLTGLDIDFGWEANGVHE